MTRSCKWPILILATFLYGPGWSLLPKVIKWQPLIAKKPLHNLAIICGDLKTYEAFSVWNHSGEKTGYENQQTSKMKRQLVLQFMFEAAWPCTILGFLFTNCHPINFCWSVCSNDRNYWKLCTFSPKKSQEKHLTKKSNRLHMHCILLCEDNIYKL